MKEQFPLYEIEGSPYEIGFQEGTLLRDRIQISLDCYKSMFMDYSGIDWEYAKDISRGFIPAIQDYNADYLDEIRGIAEGSGFAFEDILALNCRSEIVFAGNEFDKQLLTDGCTSIGISSDAGQDGHVYAGHNWDWKASQRDAMVMLKVTQSNGKPSIFMITEAGIIGKTGFNSAGLSLYLNAMGTNMAPKGVPLHIIMRGVLDCETLTEAIQMATKMPIGCCANFMLCHRNGECVDLELENEDFDVLYPENGIIVHTNHFISRRLPVYPRKDTVKYMVPDTFIRRGRADKLLRKKAEKIGTEDIQRVLTDHVEYPNSICRHEDRKADAGLRMASVFSIVIDLTEGDILFAKGNPCEKEYEHYHL